MRIDTKFQSDDFIYEVTAYDLKQVSASSSGEKMATSGVRAEQRTVIQFCFESRMIPLETLK